MPSTRQINIWGGYYPGETWAGNNALIIRLYNGSGDSCSRDIINFNLDFPDQSRSESSLMYFNFPDGEVKDINYDNPPFKFHLKKDKTKVDISISAGINWPNNGCCNLNATITTYWRQVFLTAKEWDKGKEVIYHKNNYPNDKSIIKIPATMGFDAVLQKYDYDITYNNTNDFGITSNVESCEEGNY